MTEELKTCDFYNEKICTLFSKYFGFNVECKNLFLSTIDCDIERECPIKRLEQENKELSFAVEKCLENAGIECDDEEQALRSLPMLGNAHYKVLVEKEELEQENRDLKKQIESDKGLITVGGKQQYEYLQKINELEQENKELKDLDKKICEDWGKEIKVYWNTLEEIRKIAKDIIENDVYENSDVKAEKILDKINEVLNEKEL